MKLKNLLLSLFIILGFNSSLFSQSDNFCNATLITIGVAGDNCGGLFPYDNTGATEEVGELKEALKKKV